MSYVTQFIGGSYKQRDRNVRTIGFRSYETYLKSPLWRIIREEVLLRDGCSCQVPSCSCKATQVHHISYAKSVLIGLNAGMLFSICKQCHERCELEKGKKLTAWEARQKLFFMVSGIPKHKDSSNRLISEWFQFRQADSDNKATGQKIISRIKQEVTDLYQRVIVPYLAKLAEPSVWEAPPASKQDVLALERIVRRNYSMFEVISRVQYKGTERLMVSGPGGTNKVWTEKQIIYLNETFYNGYRRRAK